MKPLALLLALAFCSWAALPVVAELMGAYLSDEVGSGVAMSLDGGAE